MGLPPVGYQALASGADIDRSLWEGTGFQPRSAEFDSWAVCHMPGHLGRR